MAFSKKIELFTAVEGRGTSPPTADAKRTVYADVKDIGITVKFSAAAAGYTAELQAIMHRKEYRGENRAVYNGTEYRVSGTGSTENPRHIRLILSRG